MNSTIRPSTASSKIATSSYGLPLLTAERAENPPGHTAPALFAWPCAPLLTAAGAVGPGQAAQAPGSRIPLASVSRLAATLQLHLKSQELVEQRRLPDVIVEPA